MNKEFSPPVIAGTYIGTVVGAGFASGQEVLQFFGCFGAWGLPAVLLASVLFILFGNQIMQLGWRLTATSHREVVYYAGGKWVGRAVDGVITFFLLGVVVVMAAGGGAVFAEHFGLPSWWGSLLMTAAAAITVLAGIGGVVAAISAIAPLLLASIFFLGIFTIYQNWGNLPTGLGWAAVHRAPLPGWPVSAVVYTSYNLVMAVAILAPLGPLSAPRKLWWGALGGGVGLGLAAGIVVLAILALAPGIAAYEVPMLAVARRMAPPVATFYSVILLAEVYTTAVSSLYGFVARLAGPGDTRFRWLVLVSAGVGFVASRFGFSTLVGTLFPAVGMAGLVMLGALGYTAMREGRFGMLIRERLRLGLSRLYPVARKVEGESEDPPGPGRRGGIR